MVKPPFPQEFDEKENLVVAPVNATYHSRLRAPARAHPTRESASHALRCLASPDPEDHVIARKILEQLLPLQIVDPTDIHYGIWGWYAEEPPREMAPADWNWADFMGVRLLQILHDHGDRLSLDLAVRVRIAVEHAAWSIFRRNVGPSYTNICAMGAVVCITAGETLPEPRLLDYGVLRLRNMLQALEFNGGFPEYNSPTYTMVVLEELERLLHLASHPEARAVAHKILARTWQLIADQFHPGTGQWAGPQSRSYQNWLDAEKVQFFEARLKGGKIKVRSADGYVAEAIELGHPVDCPEEIRTRFFELPAAPYQYRHCWVNRPDGSPAQVSTTWFTNDATLGSMDGENTWDQRRVILGYWRTPEDPAVRLRLRLMHNGRDFVSGMTRNRQEDSRILTGFYFTTGGGDFHPYFDRPRGGVFSTRDLRIRYEIEGVGAQVEEIAPGLFELRAGSHKVVLRTGPIRFDGLAAQGWSCGRDGQLVWVDGIFHSGEGRAFHPAGMGESSAAAALELLPVAQEPSPHSIQESERDGERLFRWQAEPVFEVAIPRVAPKFD
jgi:hypothetical protein